MTNEELVPHLFRAEHSKIVAVLCRVFGFEHIEIAEDIASETFAAAIETWPYKGVPPNPTAWLYTVAKNKAKNHLQRNQLFAGKISSELTKHHQEFEDALDISEQNITDSQLQMLFAVCNPVIPSEGQVGLALRILCGFGIDEVATAFLTNKATIEKRLYRAKEKLRQHQVAIEFPPDKEIDNRLGAVLTTLYLLFSEGYYSENKDNVIREELCLEAMRLTQLLLANPQTNRPEVNALFALMCFQASRFKARKNDNGETVLYGDQDESLWNYHLIEQGMKYLREASHGDRLSTYHLEASIAYWNTIKADTHEKWENILQLYNQLLQIKYSPIAALNRTFALSKANGKEIAIIEVEKLQLTDNQFYFALLGELYAGIDDQKAIENFGKALKLAKTKTDKHTIQRKIDTIAAKA